MMVVMPVMAFISMAVFLFRMSLKLLHPSRRSGHFSKIEKTRIYDFPQVYVGIVAFKHPRFGLYGTQNGTDTSGILLADLRNLVQDYDIAEFHLLYYQVLYVFLAYPFTGKPAAAVEFVFETQSVHNRGYAVETRYAAVAVLGFKSRNRTYRLRYRSRFADSARLNHNVVEPA